MSSRDCKAWLDDGLPVSTTNNESAKLLDDVITQYVTWTEFEQHGGIEGTVTKMLEGEPDFVMGNVLSIGLDLMGTTRSIRFDTELAAGIAHLSDLQKSDAVTDREKLHCKAVNQFAHEFYKDACDTWEEILIHHPNDVVALKFAHDSYFYLGNSIMIRDSVGRVLPLWKPENQYYGYLKGMYAFGLEETNLYGLAEKYAREALATNSTDCWATHAVAHCLEMTGRANEGSKFMSDTESDWSKGAMLACHNYWHWALYQIENSNFDEALGIYDQQVSKRVKGGAALDIVDAASLLKRFEFEGVNVGSRWESLYDICRPHIDDHITVFNDVHYLWCFLGASETKENVVKQFMNSVRDYLKSDAGGTNREITADVGLHLYEGVIACEEGRFDDAVAVLYPIKNKIVNIGGSHAQRDIFNQLLLHACLSSSKMKSFNLGRALLHERKLLKEHSPLTDRLMGKLLTCHS